MYDFETDAIFSPSKKLRFTRTSIFWKNTTNRNKLTQAGSYSAGPSGGIMSNQAGTMKLADKGYSYMEG